jgi:hypothetical protein
MNPAGFFAAQAQGAFDPAVQVVVVLGLFLAFCILMVLSLGLLFALTAWIARSRTPPQRPELYVVKSGMASQVRR